MYKYSRNIVTIDTNALKHNFTVLQKKIGEEKKLLAMVKADAYGHGMIKSAQAFSDAGCSVFGVAEIGEGAALREAKLKGEVLIFLGFEEQNAQLLIDYDLTPVVFLEKDLHILSQLAIKHEREIAVHLKVDTGMSRLGIFPEEAERFIKLIDKLPCITLQGVVSHLAKADEVDSRATKDALNIFESIREDHNDFAEYFHIANSGGVLNYPESHYMFSRAGISLYGYYPDSSSGDTIPLEERLKPAMTFTTKILQVKKVSKGTGVSYGHTYVADRDLVLAILPVGYEDGLPRSQSNVGEVLIKGKRAKICGRVCMNLCMVDVTDIADVSPGDEVTILGCHGEEKITADDIGKRSDTINYEILCMIGNNNARVHE